MGSPEASQIQHGANDDTSTNQDWQQGAKWFKRHRMDNTEYLNPHCDLTLEQHFKNFFTTLIYANAQPHQIKLQKVQQLKRYKSQIFSLHPHYVYGPDIEHSNLQFTYDSGPYHNRG